MRPSAVLYSALLSLLSAAGPRCAAASAVKSTKLPASFQPPAVFKNANLVHVISVEKNYVKESVNVVIENIAKEPQDEYFLRFTADEMSRVGGLEVKDRKDGNVGPFDVERVEFDPKRYGGGAKGGEGV